MYRRAIRSLFVATTAMLLLATTACDKAPEEKKPADKTAKVEEKKTEDVKPPEQPPVEQPPVEQPPVEPPADAGEVAADAGADAGAPAEGGAPADSGTPTDDKKPDDKKPDDKKTDDKKAADDKKPEPAVAKADGKAIFDSKCKSCHGADGKGDTTIGKKVNIPSLAGTKLSKSKIVSITETGVKDTKMKGFKDRLTADEIDAVATYVGKL